MHALIGLLLLLPTPPCAAQDQPAKLRALVVTGGHDFDRPPFFAMFDSFGAIEYREVTHPQANDRYAPDKAATYDVLVLYDLNQDITDAQKADLVALLEKGKGLVVLHHALADYQDWDEFLKVVGGRYHLAPWVKDGQQQPASTFHEGVDIKVHIADPDHPITKGLTDFTLHDEVYGGYTVLPTVHPLLTTDHAESTPTIAWTNTYGQSRVAVIQFGHGRGAYDDPNYRRLLGQAIQWAGGRL